jgi:hypothetical protein
VNETQLRGYTKKRERSFLQNFPQKDSGREVLGFPEGVTIFRLKYVYYAQVMGHGATLCTSDDVLGMGVLLWKKV